MSAPDEDRWERYRAARNAPNSPEPENRQSIAPRRDRPANLRRRRSGDALRGADGIWELWLLKPLFGLGTGGTTLGAIWAEGLATKILLGAIAVGIVVIWYIARDAHDEPRTTGEWAPPRDDHSKRRR